MIAEEQRKENTRRPVGTQEPLSFAVIERRKEGGLPKSKTPSLLSEHCLISMFPESSFQACGDRYSHFDSVVKPAMKLGSKC